jgi:hypothetical protein
MTEMMLFGRWIGFEIDGSLKLIETYFSITASHMKEFVCLFHIDTEYVHEHFDRLPNLNENVTCFTIR